MGTLPFLLGGPAAPATAQLTLGTLRDMVRQRADMENSEFITDSELNGYIARSYYELYDLLVQKYGDNYYVANPYTFTTDGTNDQFALPGDFYKLLGVDLQLGGSSDSWVTIRPFTFAERNRYSVPNFQSFYGVTNLRYRLSGDKIWFTPLPSAGQSIRLWYVPRIDAVADDADIIDGVSGWEEYIIVDAAIKCLQKEESDVTVLLTQKQALIARIESAAENRDAGSPERVADTQWADFWWPSGSGPGSGGSW